MAHQGTQQTATLSINYYDERIDVAGGNGLQPVAYFSAKMSDAERNYDVREQEFMALMRACLHWRHYLHGTQPFTLEEVGRAFGVTRERIRQIENSTLKRLETLPEAQGLKDCV